MCRKPLGCYMWCPGAVQPEGEHSCACTRNEERLTTKMASEDLAGVFEYERMADRWIVATVICLETLLQVELNIVRRLAWM